MTRYNQKSTGSNKQNHFDCVKPEGIAHDGVIAVHRYNAILFVECMSVSENNCIQTLFATR